MKKFFDKKTPIYFIISISIFIISGISVSTFAQSSTSTLPNVKVKDLSGKTINIQDIDNEGKPIVISFWATWCKPCLEELNTIAELFEEWKEETGVKYIAISIDDSRNSKKVAPFAKAKDWKYEIYLDENSDLKRAMGVNNPPQTFLLNKDKNIVFQHNGFAPGDEVKLYEEIKKINHE
jgi:thiol-disulfide isomerase/thioredoxin